MTSRKGSSSRARSGRSSRNSRDNPPSGRQPEHPADPAEHLAQITAPLLDFFSEAHEVFVEGEVFADHKAMRASLGRLYRSWKRNVVLMDPEFPIGRYREGQKKKARMRRRGEG